MCHQNKKYYLLKHVFLCVVDASAVLLDLHNDKYISLDPERTTTLLSLLSIGEENRLISEKCIFKKYTSNSSRQYAGNESKTIKLVGNLTRHNLLTSDIANSREETLLTVNIPPLDSSGYVFGNRPNINIGHILRFFMSCAVASLKLKFTSTEKMVNSVKRRKRWNSLNPDMDKARYLVEIFNILRPLFFASRGHCLFDSLALIEFMARYSIYPTWVFGVKMGPFLAHCWVQDNHFIYNESLAQAHYFTPIMVV